MAKKDHKEEYLGYLALWDKACEQKIFPETPKLDPLPDSDYDSYYHNIDREASEEDLLQEMSGKRENDSANPIFPDSVGKDSKISGHTAWTDEKAIEELADLKKKLYAIECKLNSKDAGGNNWNEKAVEVNDKALWRQIETLKLKIDKLSNNFGLKEEPRNSLYRTK